MSATKILPTLVLLGGGGHATVVADAARARGWSVAGYLDDHHHASEFQRATVAPLMRLGAIRDWPAVLASIGASALVHAAVGEAALRRRWLDMLGETPAPAIIHPSAVVSPSAMIEAGAFIGPLAIINARATVGRGAIVNSGAIVEHDCSLAEFCHIAPGAKLAGNVTVGAESLVGIGAVAKPGVRIGARVTIGAAAAVVCDIPDAITATGVPAEWK